MSLSWEFYSNRTGFLLSDFLSSIYSLDEAYKKFEAKGIDPPENLEEFFQELLGQESKKQQALKIENKGQESSRPRISQSNNKKESKPKKTKRPYFRKVIKKEK